MPSDDLIPVEAVGRREEVFIRRRHLSGGLIESHPAKPCAHCGKGKRSNRRIRCGAVMQMNRQDCGPCGGVYGIGARNAARHAHSGRMAEKRKARIRSRQDECGAHWLFAQIVIQYVMLNRLHDGHAKMPDDRSVDACSHDAK